MHLFHLPSCWLLFTTVSHMPILITISLFSSTSFRICMNALRILGNRSWFNCQLHFIKTRTGRVTKMSENRKIVFCFSCSFSAADTLFHLLYFHSIHHSQLFVANFITSAYNYTSTIAKSKEIRFRQSCTLLTQINQFLSQYFCNWFIMCN